jgi:hypothetical protein
MANQEHVAQLWRVNVWNKWREENPDVQPDLSGTNLDRQMLWRANLSGADLHWAHISRADLSEANLSGANLTQAHLYETNLYKANLSGAHLSGAHLSGAHLSGANLSGANLSGADLSKAILVKADLANADLAKCKIFGISAWKLNLEGAKQENLVITDYDEPKITVDNIEVAQFVYLMLHNPKIRDVISTIGNKGVLLLGRFTEGRIKILERLQEELRKRDLVPIVFNFDRPPRSDFTETIRTLAGLSRFIIADITNPKSAPLELQAVVPEYMVPLVPIIEDGQEPFAMFKDLWVKHHEWLFELITYTSVEELVQGLDAGIVGPALMRSDQLEKQKLEEMPVRRMADIISGVAHKP